MKKVYFSLFVLAAAICWGQSKTTVQTFNGKTGWKKTSQTTVAQNTQTRHVEPYDEILVEGNFEVTLVQGNEGEIHLEGPSDLIEDTVVKTPKMALESIINIGRKSKRIQEYLRLSESVFPWNTSLLSALVVRGLLGVIFPLRPTL